VLAVTALSSKRSLSGPSIECLHPTFYDLITKCRPFACPAYTLCE
jgi:hypothetical protein